MRFALLIALLPLLAACPGRFKRPEADVTADQALGALTARSRAPYTNITVPASSPSHHQQTCFHHR